MKKVVGIFMVMVFIVLFGSMAFGENAVVNGIYGDEVYDWTAEWLRLNGKDEYLYDGYEEGKTYFKGYGVLLVNEFETEFGIEFTEDNFEDIFMEAKRDEYYGLVVDIDIIDIYKGCYVYKMYAKANVPIGCWYYFGEQKPYYEGEIYFMACREPEYDW